METRRTVQTGRLSREIIDADSFCEFCKQPRSEIVGRRLKPDRRNFVQMFVFPQATMELLPVREAKKERAYDEQMKKENESLENGDEAGDEFRASPSGAALVIQAYEL